MYSAIKKSIVVIFTESIYSVNASLEAKALMWKSLDSFLKHNTHRLTIYLYYYKARNVHSMGWVFCWRMCRSALWSWWESVLRKYCMSGCGENGNAVGPVTGRHSPLYIDWSLKMEVSSCSGGTEFTFAPNLDKSEKKAIRERSQALVHFVCTPRTNGCAVTLRD